MIIFKNIKDLRNHLESTSRRDKSVGFAPTMGALHAGHISLIGMARSQCEISLCSIFVNPTQFNDPADFEKYPVTLEADIALLEQAGCDILFLPSVQEMYPEGLSEGMHYELGRLEAVYEGRYRPGHFQGVCRIVHKLLEATRPDFLFLGQKDYQQCMVIGKLIQLTGLPVNVVVCPTLREPNGLAMSSRNTRLSATEREQAAAINETMRELAKQLKPGDLLPLKEEGAKRLNQAGFRVDYFDLADARTLESESEWDGKKELVILAAAFLGEVRLIDNWPLSVQTK